MDFRAPRPSRVDPHVPPRALHIVTGVARNAGAHHLAKNPRRFRSNERSLSLLVVGSANRTLYSRTYFTIDRTNFNPRNDSCFRDRIRLV